MLRSDSTWVIHELTLATNNLEDMAGFYAVTFGLAVTFDDSCITIQIGESKFIFRQSQDSLPIKYHYAFNIPKNQLEAAKVWLCQRLDLIQSNWGKDQFRFDPWESESVYFHDADLNIVELIARQAICTKAFEPFTPRELLCVSEIGIASNAYLSMVHSMRLPVYGIATNDFAAVGGPHGLLMFVREGREWFPDTGIKALPMPLSVTLVSAYASTNFKFPPDDGNHGIGASTPTPQPPPRTGENIERFKGPKPERELAIR